MSGYRNEPIRVRIRLEAIEPDRDGGTGHRWSAHYDLEDRPQHDASGVTIENALAMLALNLARELAGET